MNIIIKRLHELTDAAVNVQAVSDTLRSEIQPADTKKGSTWVCQQAQQAHFWGVGTMQRMAENDKLGDKTMVWVALVGDRPAGICWFINEVEDALLGMFLVDTRHSQEKQWEIADAIATRSITDVLADDRWGNRSFHGWFPKNGWAADYARRCGFKSEQSGTPMMPDPNPILHWVIGMEELLNNIEALQ